jgi:predicted amidophosphoribosyltransferase
MAPGSAPEPWRVRDAFLDLLAGGACVACRRPGRRLCPWCAARLPTGARPFRPDPCPPGLVPVHAAGEYDGVLRELVLAHKERSALGLVVPLGRVLADVATDVATDAGGGHAVVLVPVPSHPAVVRARGHDPVLRIARRAARALRARGTSATVRRLLRVVGRPRDQAGLTAGERHANLAGRFDARAGERPAPGTLLLLVDDVMTSGATLREAQRALTVAGRRPHGAVTVAATRRRIRAR